MTTVTSGLNVVIETGQAASQLLALKNGLEGAAVGVARLGREIQTHAGSIQRVLGDMSKHGFGGLSQGLTQEANKVGAGMRQMEKEVVAAARSTGRGAGNALADGVSEGATKISAKTRNIVTYFEMVSRGARATSAHTKSAIEVMTTLQAKQSGAHQDLLSMYRRMEAAIGATEAAERNFRDTTSSRVKTAVASLTAENSELVKMRAHYAALRADAAKLRASAFERNLSESSRVHLPTTIGVRTGAGMGDSGMTAQYREGVSAFGAVEKSLKGVGAAADGSKTAMKAWSHEAKMAHDTARGAAAGVGYLWMTWGNIGAMAAGFGAIRGMAAGIKELVNIEQQLTHAAHAGGGTVASLNERVMSMYGNGNKMVHTAGQMAEALKNLTLAGFSTDEAFQMLTDTYKFAAAGEMDLAAAAQGMQQTMNSFRLPMTETGRVTDVLAKAAAASAVTIEDMVQAMKTGSVVGAMYNVTIEDFAKSAALLGKVGIIGQAAGTAIKNFYTEVSSPKSKKAMEAMSTFGLSFYEMSDGITKLKPLNGIIDELREKFKGLSETNQQIFLTNLNDIFNERGIKEAAQLIKMTEAEYAKLNETMDKSAGFVDALYGKLTNTTKGIYADLKAQSLAALTKALKDAEPAIQDLGKSLRDLVTSSGFRAFLEATVGLLGGLTRLLADHGRMLLTVLAIYAGFKIAYGTLGLMTVGMGRLVLATQTLVYVTKLATAGQLSFLVGTRGITGAIGKLTQVKGALVGKATAVRVALAGAWQAAGGFAGVIQMLIRGIGLVTGPIGLAVAAIAGIGTALYTNRDAVVDLGSTQATLWETMKAGWQIATRSVGEGLTALANKHAEVMGYVKAGAQVAMKGVVAALSWVSEKLGLDSVRWGDLFAITFNRIIEFAKNAVNGVIGVFAALGDVIGNTAGFIVTQFKLAFTQLSRMGAGVIKDIKAMLSGDFSFKNFNAAVKTGLAEGKANFAQYTTSLKGSVDKALATDYVGSALDKVKSALAVQIEGNRQLAADKQAEDWFNETATGATNYSTALGNVTENTAEEVAATGALTEAQKEHAKAQEKATADARTEADDIVKQVADLRAKTEELGLNDEALHALEQSRIDVTIAATRQHAAERLLAGASKAELEAIQDKVDALHDLKAAQDEYVTKKSEVDRAREAQEAWKKASEDIERSLTDALMRGFEGGKGFAKNLVDTLKNMFNTLVLRPIIQPIAQGGANFVTGMLGMGATGTASAAGTGGVSGMMGSLGSSIGSALSVDFMATGLMNTVAGTGMMSGLGAAGSLMTSGAIGSGLMMGLGAALPILLPLALLSFMGGKPSNKAAWGDVDLSTGATSNLGNMTGNKQASQGTMDSRTALLQSIGGYAGALRSLGGTTSIGTVRADVGERDGIQFGLDGGPLTSYGKDADSAVSKLLGEITAGTSGLSEAVSQLLTEFDGSANEMITYASSLAAVKNTVIPTLEGFGMYLGDLEYTALASGTALVTLMGGLESFASQTSFFVENFYSDSERLAMAQASLDQQFAALGMTTPATADAFRALAESQNLTTAAGQAAYASLMQVAPAFISVANAASQAAATAAAAAQAASAAAQQARVAATTTAYSMGLSTQVADERYRLETQILQMEGNTAALRERELALLDPANVDLQQRIYAMQDEAAAAAAAAEAQAKAEAAAQKAADAANRLKDQWGSVSDSLIDEIRRIRGELAGESYRSLAEAQARFAVVTAQARAGDQDAAKMLPDLSRDMLQLAQATATSYQDYARIAGQTASSMATTVTGYGRQYGFAVPDDIYTGGGRVEPKTVKPKKTREEREAEKAARDLERAELRAIRLALGEIVKHSARTARTLDDAARGAAPLTTEVAV